MNNENNKPTCMIKKMCRKVNPDNTMYSDKEVEVHCEDIEKCKKIFDELWNKE